MDKILYKLFMKIFIKSKTRIIILCSILAISLFMFITFKKTYEDKDYSPVCMLDSMDYSFIKNKILKDIDECIDKLFKMQKRIEEKKRRKEERKRIKNEFKTKIESLQYDSRKQWFVSYKSILEEYRRYPYIEVPLSVYDEYEIGEIRVFQRLVAAETTGGDFESKCNVASVVWNRIQSSDYPDKIVDVIYERNGSVQFTPTCDGRIDSVEVTEEDILAVEYTYMFGSTAYDCIAFDNVKGNSWNKNRLEIMFTDSINHTFYR